MFREQRITKAVYALIAEPELKRPKFNYFIGFVRIPSKPAKSIICRNPSIHAFIRAGQRLL